eukprot:CAMPEP_0197703750 /NCGR_PEP_ID=MMETSP1338-20131121/125593_1 /TAXON_ID=43686 ORGANISM="Pelagodinium beii, Strain RCC1491" /NCGR_SAMPLE_ID=MMETSP1338 /ASSEMBLY_ACC=CAM_ASM_000754 /LENGTH=1160 /DNA_ID=CAMNT_0043287649 /DNA_START=57 /DNA_END=3539 /DNA_ORIENTATION=+
MELRLQVWVFMLMLMPTGVWSLTDCDAEELDLCDDDSTSDDSASDGSTSDGSTSDGSASDGSTSDGSTSDGSTPDDTTSASVAGVPSLSLLLTILLAGVGSKSSRTPSKMEWTLAALACLLTIASAKDLPASDDIVTKISFSSCMHQDPAGFGSDVINFSAWDAWASADADFAIFGGDNVYGDCSSETCTELAEAYADLKNISSFQRFMEKQAVVATWDDHDYGKNNAGASFGGKDRAKEEFLKFYEVPENDERRSHGGVYTSYLWGSGNSKLQLILLDTRWFKDEDTILGEEQWAWLADQFAVEADLRILVSSIQYLGNYFEGWYHYPCEQQKLMSILPNNVIIISGDRHVGAFYQYGATGGVEMRWRDDGDRAVAPLIKKAGENEPLLEVTSSSLTHTWAEAGAEEGPHRIPEFDLMRANHYGVMGIDWTKREVTVSLIASDGGPESRVFTVSIPESSPGRISGTGLTSPTCGQMKSVYKQHECCGNPTKDLENVVFRCEPPAGDASTSTMMSLLPLYGSTPQDPIMDVFNASVSALMTAGEYTDLAYDSMWQAPASWGYLSIFTGPADGQGIKVISKNKLRVYANNEISSATGTTAYTTRLSAVDNKGGFGQPIPASSESWPMVGAQVRFTDLELEYSSGSSNYKIIQGGFAVKRLYVSTDAVPTGKLITSQADSEATTGLKGLSRLCGSKFVMAHEFDYKMSGAGFEDEIYIGGHEDGTFGAYFALDTQEGNMYLLPQPTMVETATPLYTGTTEYVAIVMNVYPESDGQRLHLFVGKKTGSDFLGRNGLNPEHGFHYMLQLDNQSMGWDDMTDDTFYPGKFELATEAGYFLESGSKKNEWSSINKHMPNMYAQALTGLDDIAVLDVTFDFSSTGCTTSGGSQLPCSLTAKVKRFRLKDLDPIFGEPDGLYWSPKGQLIIAEDGATGRLIRMDLDQNGSSVKNWTVLARVADESKRTQANAIPQFSMKAASQGEFTGIIPAGFYHKIDGSSTAADYLNAELEAKEQYFVNYQLHSLGEGLVKAKTLGEGTQTLRVDVDADTDDAPTMYAWKGVGYYNGKRESYCAANDCTDHRGPFVAGEVVRVSDWAILEVWRESYCAANDCTDHRGPFVAGEVVRVSDWAILEVWREKAPGTYTNDLDTIVAESLSYSNMEAAGF